MEQEFSSALLENAVSSLSRLPGVGRKTALRFALHLLRRPSDEAVTIGEAIINLRTGIRYCSVCHNISESEVCSLCASPKRDRSIVCVVENVKDVMSIERTREYRGLYHVLGGAINPMANIGPNDLNIAQLLNRLQTDEVKEIIVALNPNIEGEATTTYLSRLLPPLDVKVTRLASGLPVGGDLEYADEITLSRALQGRQSV